MKKLKVSIAALFFSLLIAMTGFAGIEYDMDESPSVSRTIKWSSTDGDSEYRYVSGVASADAFDSAASAGSGGSASITVTDNGVYTLFAKTDDIVQVMTVPVTTIDKNGPDITLTDVKRNSDGTVDVYYEASDYFGVAETRIAFGSQPASAFSSAVSISGGVISGLQPGNYTIFAKDTAGNITTYPLIIAASAETWSTESVERSEWSTEWSTEWGSNWIHYEYEVPTIVLISKCDMTTGKELAGAKLEITDDSDGSTVVKWTTDGTQTQIKNTLEKGRTYTLTENAAPDGYEIAGSVKFTVKEDGSITQVIMYDKPKKSSGGSSHDDPEAVVLISKSDIIDAKELAGATLEITDENGSIVMSWVTAGEVTRIVNKLKPGKTYTLTEKIAPEGYEIAESVTFKVKEDGSITHVFMYDRPKTTNVTKTEPTTSIEMFPQTGGFMDTRVFSMVFGVALVICGSVAMVYISRKEKHE